MKKILLTLLSFIAFTGVYAQSLSLVVYDHQTKEELATVNPGDTYNAGYVDYAADYGMWNIKQIYFYVKNNSDKSGTANFTSYEKTSEAAESVMLSICENVCYSGIVLPKDMDLASAGEYRGLNGSMDFQLFASGDPSGVATFKVYLKFSEDSEPCVFYLQANYDKAGSGINSSSVEKSLNVYQSGTGVVANYSFDNAAERYISVYNLAGEIVGKFKLAGEAGNEVLPVSLNKGIYLYALEENGKSLKAHKFIVK